jgi:hypothetical protein
MDEPAETELVVISATHNPLVQAQHGDGGTDPTEARKPTSLTSASGGRVSTYTMNAEKYKALLSKATRKSSKRAMLMSVRGVVFGFTFMMSTFETSNRTMIIVTMTSFAGTVGLAAHLKFGEAGLACYAAFLLVMGGLVYHAVRSLEAVEVFKEKYEAAYRECTKGIEPDSDQLGPRPLSNSNLMQVHNSPQATPPHTSSHLYPHTSPHLCTSTHPHLATPPYLRTSTHLPTPLHIWPHPYYRRAAPPHLGISAEAPPHLSTPHAPHALFLRTGIMTSTSTSMRRGGCSSPSRRCCRCWPRPPIQLARP